VKLKKLLGAAALAFVSTSAAQAAVVMNIWEDGSDVRAQVRGTLNLGGYDETFLTYGNSFMSGDTFLLGRDNPDTFYSRAYRFNYDAGPDEIGAVTFKTPISSVGTDFGMVFGAATPGSATDVIVSDTFLSGGTILSDSLFSATDLASMELITGNYLFALPQDTIEIIVGEAPAVSAVPLPASAPFLAAGLGLMAWAGRRRRRT
jgi:hypothetical protein